MSIRSIKAVQAISPLVGPDLRYDAVVDMCDLASSHWQSLAHAAYREDRHLMVLHCRQIKALTVEVAMLVRQMVDEKDM
jgi:hypothetical protein